MITFNFPGTGEKISRLGFGLMRLPTLESGGIDKPAASALVDRAIAGGVNYFDTAYYYHNGESEVFAGEALAKYPRESYYLATKLPSFSLKEASDVPRIFEDQLRRCRTDYFDFYLLHALDADNWQKAKQSDALAQADTYKKQGRIRHLGFSYHGDLDTFREVLDAYPWEFVQIQINYMDEVMINARAFHDELCARNIPAVIMEPMHGGMLARLPETAAGRIRRADVLRSPAEWAFRWCLSLPNAPLILSGMGEMAQVEENLRVFSEHKPLSGRELAMLADVREDILAVKAVPCTGCAYCMDCPSGVDIPAVMQIYNKFKLFDNPYALSREYGELKTRSGKSCTKCGECLPKCPQSIEIPDWMGQIDEIVKSLKL